MGFQLISGYVMGLGVREYEDILARICSVWMISWGAVMHNILLFSTSVDVSMIVM